MNKLSTESSSDVEEIELGNSSKKKEDVAKKDGEIVWRAANGFMTLFFIMATGVQFNDPDPFLWVPLYGTAALLTFGITVKPKFSGTHIWLWTYRIHAALCVGMFLYVIVQFIIAATHPMSNGSLNPLTYEEGREMAGVMITTVWLFTCKQSPIIRCDFSKWCPCFRSKPSIPTFKLTSKSLRRDSEVL